MLIRPEQHLNRFLRELEQLVNSYLNVHHKRLDARTRQVKQRLLRSQLIQLLATYQQILCAIDVTERLVEVGEHLVDDGCIDVAAHIFFPYARQWLEMCRSINPDQKDDAERVREAFARRKRQVLQQPTIQIAKNRHKIRIEEQLSDAELSLMTRLENGEYRCAVTIHGETARLCSSADSKKLDELFEFMDEWLGFLENRLRILFPSPTEAVNRPFSAIRFNSSGNSQLHASLHDFYNFLLKPLLHDPDLSPHMLVPALRLTLLFELKYRRRDGHVLKNLYDSIFKIQVAHSSPLVAMRWLNNVKAKWLDEKRESKWNIVRSKLGTIRNNAVIGLVAGRIVAAVADSNLSKLHESADRSEISSNSGQGRITSGQLRMYDVEFKHYLKRKMEIYIFAMRIRALADPEWYQHVTIFESLFDMSSGSHQPANPLIPRNYELILKRRKFAIKHDEKMSRKLKLKLGENVELPRFSPLQVTSFSLGYHMSQRQKYTEKGIVIAEVLSYCSYVTDDLRAEKPIFNQLLNLLSDLLVDIVNSKDEVLNNSSVEDVKLLIEKAIPALFSFEDWKRMDEYINALEVYEIPVTSLAVVPRALLNLRLLWNGSKLDKKKWHGETVIYDEETAILGKRVQNVLETLKEGVMDILDERGYLRCILNNSWALFSNFFKDLSHAEKSVVLNCTEIASKTKILDLVLLLFDNRRLYSSEWTMAYGSVAIRLLEISKSKIFEKKCVEFLKCLENLRTWLNRGENMTWTLDNDFLQHGFVVPLNADSTSAKVSEKNEEDILTRNTVMNSFSETTHVHVNPSIRLARKISCLQIDLYFSLYRYYLKDGPKPSSNALKTTKGRGATLESLYEAHCVDLARENPYLQAIFWTVAISSHGDGLDSQLKINFAQRALESIKRACEYERKQVQWWAQVGNVVEILTGSSSSLSMIARTDAHGKPNWVKVLAKKGKNTRVTALDDSYEGSGLLIKSGRFSEFSLSGLEENEWMTFKFYSYENDQVATKEGTSWTAIIMQPQLLIPILGYVFRTAVDRNIISVQKEVQEYLFGYFTTDNVLSAVNLSKLPTVNQSRLSQATKGTLHNIVEATLNKYGIPIEEDSNLLVSVGQAEQTKLRDCYALCIALNLIGHDDARLACLLCIATYQLISPFIHRETLTKSFKTVSLFIHQKILENCEQISSSLKMKLAPILVRLTFVLCRLPETDKVTLAKDSVAGLKQLVPYPEPVIYSTVKLSHVEEMNMVEKLKKNHRHTKVTSLPTPEWIIKMCQTFQEYLSLSVIVPQSSYLKELGHTTTLHEIVQMLKNHGPEVVTKELLKFRKNERFLELTVSIIRWSYNHNKLDYVVDICMEIFEWLHRRNKYLLYPQSMNESEKRFWRRRGYFRGAKQTLVADPPSLKIEKPNLKHMTHPTPSQAVVKSDAEIYGRSPSPCLAPGITKTVMTKDEAAIVLGTRLPKIFKRYKYRLQFRYILKQEAESRAEMAKIFGLALLRKSEMVDDGADLVKTPSMPTLNKGNRKKPVVTHDAFDLNHCGTCIQPPAISEADRTIAEDQILLPDVLQSLTQYAVLSSRYGNYRQTFDAVKRLWNVNLQLRSEPVGRSRLYHEYVWRSLFNAANSLLDTFEHAEITIEEVNDNVRVETKVPKGILKDIPDDFLYNFTPSRLSGAVYSVKWNLNGSECRTELNFPFFMRFLVRTLELLFNNKQYNRAIEMGESINLTTGFIWGEKIMKLIQKCQTALKQSANRLTTSRDELLMLEKKRAISHTQIHKARSIVTKAFIESWKKSSNRFEIPLLISQKADTYLKIYKNVINEAVMIKDNALYAKSLREIGDFYYLTGENSMAQEFWSNGLDIEVGKKGCVAEMLGSTFDYSNLFLHSTPLWNQWRQFQGIVFALGKYALVCEESQKSSLLVCLARIISRFLHSLYGHDFENVTYKDLMQCISDIFSGVDADFSDDMFSNPPEVLLAIIEAAGKEAVQQKEGIIALHVLCLHEYVSWNLCDDKKLYLKGVVLRLKANTILDRIDEVESLRKATENYSVLPKEPKIHPFLDSARYRRDINDEMSKTARLYGPEFINEVNAICKSSIVE